MGKDISFKRAKLVFAKTDFHCAYCGKKLRQRNDSGNTYYTCDDATIDHIVLRSKGGSNNLDNLLPCCRSCNTSKGTKSLEEFRFWRTFKMYNTPTFSTEQLLYLSSKIELSKLFPPLVKFYYETSVKFPRLKEGEW